MSLSRRRFLGFLGLAPVAGAAVVAGFPQKNEAGAAARSVPRGIRGIERRPCPACAGKLVRFAAMEYRGAGRLIECSEFGFLRCTGCRRIWTPHELEFLESHRDPYPNGYVASPAKVDPASLHLVVGDPGPHARIPMVVLEEWRANEGINWRTDEGLKRIMEKLGEPEYQVLRTSRERISPFMGGRFGG